MSQIASLIEFWRNDIGPKGWYAGTPDIDDAIRSRFLTLWDEAADGGLGIGSRMPKAPMPTFFSRINSPAICSETMRDRSFSIPMRGQRQNWRWIRAGICRSMNLSGNSFTSR